MTAGPRRSSSSSAREAETAEPDGSGEPAASAVAVARFVVVPRAPGPLLYLTGAKRRDGDDIDAAIDELFGDITEENPGRFDIALLIAGVALIAWWSVSAMSGPGLVLGAISIILGLALPARNAVRKANRRWTSVRDRRLMDKGYPLDVSDPAVRSLVGAYEQLRAVAVPANASRNFEAIVAGHRAVIEAATLLGSVPPAAAADTRYVRERTRAIKRLSISIEAANTARASRRTARGPAGSARRPSTGAVARAREQLDESTGLGSIDELEALAERIDGQSGRQRDG